VFAGSASEEAPGPVLKSGQTLAELRAYLHRHTPRFEAPTDAAKWKVEAAGLRKRVLDQVVLRGVPESWLAGPPSVVWGEGLPAEGYIIRKLRYEVVPGLWVGALLYEPDFMEGKVPAVLNVNGHVGKPGMSVDYKQARCINLAKRGVLALNTEWIGMGELRGPGYAHNDLAYLDLCGRAGVSVFYLALKRGLDVLCAHKSTDRERVAVTGLSGGGWQTILISALDERVKLAAPNAGYIGLASRIEHSGDIGDREQNATDLVSVADYVHLTALLAPRPALLIYNAKDECCFQADRARPSVYEPIVPLYRLLGHADRFACHVNSDPGTHNYLRDNREAFFRFLNRHFLAESEWINDDLPVEDEIRTQEELAIAYPAENADFHTLAAEAMKSLPRRWRPAGDGEAVEQRRRETRRALREIVRLEPAPTGPPAVLALSTIPAFIDGVPGYASRFPVGDSWTVPVVEFAPKESAPSTTTLVLADDGLAAARDAVGEVLARGERAIAVDLLFTGECMPPDKRAWTYAQMISTVGRRVLGIQVSQLKAIAEHVRERHPNGPLRVRTKGRIAGLAALVYSALHPGEIDALALHDMEPSLKDLLTKKVGYTRAPSMFCFGLLERVDVPELIDLAEDTEVHLNATD
jgi:hypothetical protein